MCSCKRNTMELLFRAKFRIAASSVHTHLNRYCLYIQWVAVFVPVPPVDAIFRCLLLLLSQSLDFFFHCCRSASFSFLVFIFFFFFFECKRSLHKLLHNCIRSMVYHYTSELQPPHLQWLSTCAHIHKILLEEKHLQQIQIAVVKSIGS